MGDHTHRLLGEPLPAVSVG